MTPESRLTEALIAACPKVLGVSIQKWDDKTTWIVSYTDDATDADRVAARAVIATFDKDKPGLDDIRQEAARRIEAKYPVYKQLNVIRSGGEELKTMSAYVDAVRAASNDLEGTLPNDFANAIHWPADAS